MRLRTLGIGLVVLSVAPVHDIAAQLTKSWHAGPTYSTLANPIVRKPSGYEEVQLDQSAGGVGGRAGFLLSAPKWGIGLDATFFKASFESFSLPSNIEFSLPPDQATGSTRYEDPAYQLVGADLILHVTPFSSKLLGFYGVLGMTNKTESYTLSGAAFSEWNGAQSRSEFTYNYGLGVRIVPFRYFALTADMRLAPGDASYSCRLGEEVGPNLYVCEDGHSLPSKMARLMVLGGSVVF